MASGRLPFRQATFPAVICKGKRKRTKEKRTLSTQIEKQKNRGLSLSLLEFFLSFLGREYRLQYSSFSSSAF